MPSRLPSILVAGLLWSGVLLLTPTVSVPAAKAGACSFANLKPRTANVNKIRSAVRCLVNRERVRHGLRVLRTHRGPIRAAQEHSFNMVRHRFFGHQGPDGTPESRLRAAGYKGRLLGENIAWGTGMYSSPAAAVSGWMRSADHRRTILGGRFRHTGVGVAIGSPWGGGGATYTQTFGGP